MAKKLTQSPNLVYSDKEGNIYEDSDYQAMGRSGYTVAEVDLEDWIPLPDGGSLFTLPERFPLGLHRETGELGVSALGQAVAAFIPPAYTGLHVAAYEEAENAPLLSLFCYTAVGWYDGQFYVPAVRIEKDIRQEASGFDTGQVRSGIKEMEKHYPDNRLVQHLADNCYSRYDCPAAKNYFMHRWECPIPTSPACNSNCLGCISLQDDETEITSPQDRLDFKPSVEEIVEYTVPHLMTAPYPIVSFGQGCEGEPLLMTDTIEKAIYEMRKHTDKGMINMNTNASRPQSVEKLRKAGLDSIRISLNSTQKKYYDNYYRPNNYSFEDVVKSGQVMKESGGWVSLNYFVFPGFTDSYLEYESLRSFIQKVQPDLIQWRNLNIDPDLYLHKIQWEADNDFMGIRQMMDRIQEEFPDLKYGYFNPSKERVLNYDNVPQ